MKQSNGLRLRDILIIHFLQAEEPEDVEIEMENIKKAEQQITKHFEDKYNKYKLMVDEANKYKKENRNYQETCKDNEALRLILGCQVIELKNMVKDVKEFKDKYKDRVLSVRAIKDLLLNTKGIHLEYGYNVIAKSIHEKQRKKFNE